MKKALTESERRELLEQKAAERRAREIAAKQKDEEERTQACKNCYDAIWRQFQQDSKKGKSFAYVNLRDNLAEFASFLVPLMMTAKEHMQLISQAEENIKSDGSNSGEDPRQLIASWLSTGSPDLSRIPLEKPKVIEEETVDA
jgi:hypothetical protein